MQNLKLIAAAVAAAIPVAAEAAVIFDFASQGTGTTQFQLVGNDPQLGAVTITVTSTYVENSQLKSFNSDPGGFGITGSIQGNNLGAGESFTFSFDKPVTLDAVTFNSGFTGASALDYASGSISGSFAAANGAPYEFAGDPQLAANTPLAFTVVDGRFRFRSITVSAVPEPTTLSGLALGGMICLGRRRRA